MNTICNVVFTNECHGVFDIFLYKVGDDTAKENAPVRYTFYQRIDFINALLEIKPARAEIFTIGLVERSAEPKLCFTNIQTGMPES